MKTESFKAGYSFVRGMRALAYTGMTAGILTSIGLTGYHIYQASSSLSTLCDVDNTILANITEKRDKEEARLVAMKAEYEANIAAKLAEDEANIEEKRAKYDGLVANLPQEEAAFRSSHQSKVDSLNNRLRAATDALNSAANEAEQEVKKVSPLSADYDFQELQFDTLTSASDCESFARNIVQAEANVDGLQNELYRSILSKLNDIKNPIQAKKAELENEIARLNGDIARWDEDIKKIENKYTTETKIITYQRVAGKYLNLSCVFNQNGSQDREQKLRGLGNTLPILTASFTSGGMIQENDVQELRQSIARLSAWLPVYRESTGEEKTGERVVKEKNFYPTFTEDDKKSINELNSRIAEKNTEIKKIEREQIAPLIAQLNKVDAMINEMEKTKSTILAEWTVTEKVSPIASACEELKAEFEKFAVELPAMQANHRHQLQVAEQDVNSAVENKQKNWENGCASRDLAWKQGCEAKDKAWQNDCDMREVTWQIGCKGISTNFLLSLIFDGMVLVGSWISWAAMLILMDFVVSSLVIALRAQEVHKLMEKKAETDCSK